MKKMNKLFLISLTVCFPFCLTFTQEKAISFNYLNIGKGDGGNWNSGVGVQAKLQLKNRLFLLPDAGYIFENVKTLQKSNSGYSKKSNSYLFANVNLAYSLIPKGFLNIIPYIGAGYYHDFVKTRMYSKGSGSSGIGLHPGICAPYDVIDKYTDPKIMANIGVLIEKNITENVFLTIGCKYMIDTYSGDSYAPYFNAGIGYCF